MKSLRFLASICLSLFVLDGIVKAANVTAFYDFEGVGDDRFDDPAGAFADDLVGQRNPMFSADASPALGSSQSASFAGDTVLFTDAYTTDLGPDPNAFTVMFWIKARDIDQENNNTRLLSTRRRPDNSYYGTTWQVEGFGDPDNNDGNPNNDGQKGDSLDMRSNNGLSSPDDVLLFTNDATNALARADQGEDVANWHHVAFVWANSGDPGDGGAYSLTYVDGTLMGGVHGEGEAWDGFNIANQEGQFIIGGDTETAGTRAFTGLLDDVALFAGIVDEADIVAIAAGTLSPASITTDPPIVGDINNDDVVDRKDVAEFVTYYGANGDSTFSTGDFNDDSDTSLADLALMQKHFGESTASPAAVPEPSALILSVLGMMGSLRFGRWRKRNS